MVDRYDICAMADNILTIKDELEKLKKIGEGINCIEKNIERMSACLKMLELNVNDVAEILCD